MMDFDTISHYTRVPDNARLLLEKPEKEIKLTLNLRLGEKRLVQADAFVVYHNTARGPAKGGLRFAANVTLEETRDLAERMVWKTALTKIPFGGGKSAVSLDPKSLSRQEKVAILKEFVHLIKEELFSGNYIPAPDLGTNPSDMAVIYGETHRPETVTGKPPSLGGLPGRKEATGRGVATISVLALKRLLNISPEKASFAVQGFGNVGSWTAQFLSRSGMRLVAASDIGGGIFNESGLGTSELVKWAESGQTVSDFSNGERISNEQLLSLPVDVLIPAACENVPYRTKRKERQGQDDRRGCQRAHHPPGRCCPSEPRRPCHP